MHGNQHHLRLSEASFCDAWTADTVNSEESNTFLNPSQFESPLKANTLLLSLHCPQKTCDICCYFRAIKAIKNRERYSTLCVFCILVPKLLKHHQFFY